MPSAFGQHAANIGGAHIDCWGRGPLLLRFGGKEWWFEHSDMFGPLLLRKSDLEPMPGQPTSDTHPFWPAFTAWQRGGYRHRPVYTRGSKVTGKRRLRFYICHAPTTDGRP
ncbi:hypothetical protein [Salipiger abyssi]|uniref:hypothetical protein n=1 Tax=Salipiger abyssi TaxID=1250539 RepID=UPI001A8EA27F|nr:hypothetical protein [Salipiger abyssi]MBN9890090.1 hypothetical protein [Salipiger abyssi]